MKFKDKRRIDEIEDLELNGIGLGILRGFFRNQYYTRLLYLIINNFFIEYSKFYSSRDGNFVSKTVTTDQFIELFGCSCKELNEIGIISIIGEDLSSLLINYYSSESWGRNVNIYFPVNKSKELYFSLLEFRNKRK